jgi:hypothetical protein
VLRDYGTAGAQLALPGIARTFAPRAHQRAAVARILDEPAVGLLAMPWAQSRSSSGSLGPGRKPAGPPRAIISRKTTAI